MGIIQSCKAWLAALPPGTLLEQVNPAVEDGLSVCAVRGRIKKLKNQVEMLKGVPIPPSNVRDKVLTYVQGLTRPVVSGIALDETLTVQWPSGLHALMAFLQPDVLVDRLMVEINRIANTPWPPAEREQQIAELEREIERLHCSEEAIVVATGAPREAGCPPWVVLGVTADKSRRGQTSRGDVSKASSCAAPPIRTPAPYLTNDNCIILVIARGLQ
jgi:hypothetical protein